jgi:acyl-CoA thioesterase-2
LAPENGPSAPLQPDRSVSNFLSLRPGGRPNSWLFDVTKELAGATGTLHGGCGLAAVAVAMEATNDRPVSFISGQFLSRAPVGSTVTIDVEQLIVGNQITQTAATCTHEDVVVLRAAGGLGGRELGVDRSWLTAPIVPPPDECPPRGPVSETGYSFTDQANIRLAGQEPGKRTVRYWARLPERLASTAPGLIALADLLPSGMRVSLDSAFRGSSLDHTVRIASLVSSEWVLMNIESAAIRNSIGHGTIELYAQTGELLAIGSQSFALSKLTGDLDR